MPAKKTTKTTTTTRKKKTSSAPPKTKRPTGRPPILTSVEECEEKIQKYFEWCDGEIMTDDAGKVLLNNRGEPIIINRHPPTTIGLALALGFVAEQSLYDYCKRPGYEAYSEPITRARARIQQYTMERLYDRDGARGAEFVMKYCYGYAKQDQQEQEQNSALGVVELSPIMENPGPPKDGKGVIIDG